MPIVIDELIVTAKVMQSPNREADRQSRGRDSFEKEALIQECVEQVLRQLDRKQER